ncbi:alpha/beta hydrolase domain-containing protein 11 [Carex littledalei]|uniref:Alpha/beta hydrolase domain-containing protein 11 n=1 Tax=Carex littledalei TaxID=544730 RepID=A0A833RAG9_9POAL|nr:alpha/beta hydrolase domain-containing protein 11 [Carex littledalei]
MARRALEASSSLSSRLLFSSTIALLTKPISSPLHDSIRHVQTLAYEEIQASPSKPFNRTAFVFHGLLGSGRNWRTFSRSLATELDKRSPENEWRLVLVDLRNHGRSAHIEGLKQPHNISNAAEDVANLVKLQNWAWPDVVIGHSMGGKVALDFATSCARGDYGQSAIFPKQLWVLDSVPGEVITENNGDEIEKVLLTLKSLPSHLPSRKWVVDHMLSLGFSKTLSEWIGSNLKKSGESVVWSFDLDAAIDMFNSYRETSYWPLLEHPPKGLEIAMVQAEKSDRWQPHILQKLEALSKKEHVSPEEGKVSFHVLPNAGHWVQVDNPKGLLEIMTPNFLS